MTALKILYACMLYDYGDPGRGVGVEHIHFYHSLQQMGHTIIPFHYDVLISKVEKKKMNEMLLEKVYEEKPDIQFVCLFTDQFNQELLGKISSTTKTTTVNWCCDDHWRFADSAAWAPYFNWMVTTSSSALPLYQQSNFPNVIKSQWGCNPEIHKKLNLDKIYDVSFVGQPHGNRKELISALLEAGIHVNLRGYGWPNGGVSLEEMINIFNQSKIVLNFSNTSVYNIPQIKARDFEAPACGSFYITGYNEELKEYYDFEKEVSTYKDKDELIKKIQYYLSNDEEREEIAHAGYLRAVTDHNYTKRFNNIFKKIERHT